MGVHNRLRSLEGKLNAGIVPAEDRLKIVFSEAQFDAAKQEAITKYGIDALHQVQFVLIEDPWGRAHPPQKGGQGQ